jgi:hypothetical protein
VPAISVIRTGPPQSAQDGGRSVRDRSADGPAKDRLALGYGHVGMTAAPMTGKVVADLVAGRAPSIDITPFAAGRFT